MSGCVLNKNWPFPNHGQSSVKLRHALKLHPPNSCRAFHYQTAIPFPVALADSVKKKISNTTSIDPEKLAKELQAAKILPPQQDHFLLFVTPSM